MSGPLQGISVVELAGIGPVPFAGMMLADLGANVTRVDRPDPGALAIALNRSAAAGHDPTARSRRSILVDLKQRAGAEVVLKLVGKADILIEGWRPGVAERLGVGPESCLALNPALVYGRITGWGQNGPLSGTVGHDINYLSISGTLSAIGTAELPLAPLNLVGDYGGGAMLLLVGVLSGLAYSKKTGRGQVVDAAMVDGSALLASIVRGGLAAGTWKEQRQANLLDGGAPFYRTYQTSEGGFVAVGALEPQFYAALLAGLGFDADELPGQYDVDQWPQLTSILAARFGSRSRGEWEEVFAGTDACVSPVLSLSEALAHPHTVARRTFVEISGVAQPAPAPRFSQTDLDLPREPGIPGADTGLVLSELGYNEDEIGKLRRAGAVSGSFRED